MDTIFTYTEEIPIKSTFMDENLKKFPTAIYEHTGWRCAYTPTPSGCILQPTFCNMPYRNAFVPEINIEITQNVLQLKGKPIKAVRIFMGIWFSFLAALEAILLLGIVAAKIDSPLVAVLPFGLGTFGYLLCHIATKSAFKFIVASIRKDQSI